MIHSFLLLYPEVESVHQRFMNNYSADDLLKLQERGLRWTIAHVYEHSPFYRQRFKSAGIEPSDIQGVGDLAKLPFTAADDLRAGYPFPLLSVPYEKVVRIHASSGTTGKKKVMAYTEKDLADWGHFFARCYEMAGLTVSDRVQIAVGYGLWTAGAGFQRGCELFGAMAIPTGPGNVDMQCELAIDFQSTVLCCTASMGLLMAEEVHRRGIRDRLNLRKVILGSERSSRAMLQRIKELLGVDDVFDIPGMTELYGPGTGLDCSCHQGIHYWSDYYLVEIIDPHTLEPVPSGTMGEMVVTTLRKEAAPLIRYRTRDVSRLLPGQCPCGSPFPRHDRILGRTDMVFKYRAVNVYPGQIDELLSLFPQVSSEYQIFLDRRPDGRDEMLIKVEANPSAGEVDCSRTATAIVNEIRRKIMVTCRVEVVAYQSLPRTERKSERVIDHRYDDQEL
ncbi:MAG: phenylacetate--CoA ligase [Deltaproteobacteria bacterium]|nr:phenylacetate--CoA ligase [Candidatus Anaeroferrophillus wilburensis]MBN2888303.1 phenylacetate--CoA ligase [Deltaproteobacteria bacterium]